MLSELSTTCQEWKLDSLMLFVGQCQLTGDQQNIDIKIIQKQYWKQGREYCYATL